MPWTVYNSDGQILQGSATLANDSVDSQHYVAASIDNEHLADDAVGADELAANAVVNASIASGAAIDATKIADGSVTSAEFQYINTLSSNAQTQIALKAPIATPTFTTSITIGSATITEAELEILDGATVTTTELNLLDALDRGSIVYGNSSGATTVLGQGSADTVLTSDGTDIAWQAAAAGGISAAQMMAYESPPDFVGDARGIGDIGVAKVWCQISQPGNLAIPDYGVASVTDTGTGNRTIVFSIPFSTIVYAPLGIVAGMAATTHSVHYPAASGFAVGSIQFDVYNDEGNTLVDELTCHAIFGEQ